MIKATIKTFINVVNINILVKMAISIYPDLDLERRIIREAELETRTLSNFVLHTIKKYLKDKEVDKNG